MLLIITGIGKKAKTIIKTLLAIAILIILCMQFICLMEDAVDYYQRWLNRNSPHGNPMKVFKSIDHSIVNWESNMIIKLKQQYKTKESRE